VKPWTGYRRSSSNDGKLDAGPFENLVGAPLILRSRRAGSESHWISFQLEGVKSNRLALMHACRATAGDLVQLGEVNSGGSYLLAVTTFASTFGLGDPHANG